MKLIKYYKNKAGEKARRGVTLALDDQSNITEIGLANGFISYDVVHQDIEYLNLKSFEVEEVDPPSIKRGSAKGKKKVINQNEVGEILQVSEPI